MSPNPKKEAKALLYFRPSVRPSRLARRRAPENRFTSDGDRRSPSIKAHLSSAAVGEPRPDFLRDARRTS